MRWNEHHSTLLVAKQKHESCDAGGYCSCRYDYKVGEAAEPSLFQGIAINETKNENSDLATPYLDHWGIEWQLRSFSTSYFDQDITYVDIDRN